MACQWERVLEICRGALERGEEERGAYLDRVCASELRSEVDRLLADEARAGLFLVPPSDGDEAGAGVARGSDRASGQRIGHYTITGVLGRGGMGTVYEALQDEPRRRVALKVIRSMPWADDVAARLFRREARALARLEHPGIARIYDAGHGDEGWYYFAMELIEGEPLTAHARRRALPLRARLELFRLVCDAVHFAHQRGVIHLDLKPSNILVGPQGTPTVLDFGLARIADRGDDQTRATQPGGFQGTLAYASPEQARGRPDDIDARSDVYSLGVVLYELVTEEHPLEVGNLSLAEATRLICERPPARAGSIRRELRGEVETVIAKALEKEPMRRYTSAAALADDIERHLQHRPILGHPPSTLYQLRTMVARHRVPAALLAVLLIVLVVAPVWLGVVYARAHAAESDAREEAKTATRTKDFLLELFNAHDPDVGAGAPLTAEQLLERGADRALAELRDEPLVQAELLDTIGTVLRVRDRLDRAVALHEAALGARLSILGERHADAGLGYLHLADSYDAANRFDDARRCYEAAIGILTVVHGEMHADTARALSGLGSHLRPRDLARAEALHRRALEILRELHGERHEATAEAMCDLAIDLRRLRRFEEAEPLYRRALAMRLEMFGENRVSVANNYQSLAVLMRNMNRHAEAEENYLRAQSIYRRLLGGTNRLLASNISNLGLLYWSRGEPLKAVEAFEESLAIHRALVGDVHMDVAWVLDLLGQVVRTGLHDPASALPLLEESLEIRRRLEEGEGHGTFQLGVTMFWLGRHEEVVALFAGERSPDRMKEGTENLEVSLLMYGTSLVESGRAGEAVPILERAVATYGRQEAPDLQQSVSARVALAKAYLRVGRVAEAEGLLVELCPPVTSAAQGSMELDPVEPHFFGVRDAMGLLREICDTK